MYTALAARAGDPKRSEVLKRMAGAEVTHRARLEGRRAPIGVARHEADSAERFLSRDRDFAQEGAVVFGQEAKISLNTT